MLKEETFLHGVSLKVEYKMYREMKKERLIYLNKMAKGLTAGIFVWITFFSNAQSDSLNSGKFQPEIYFPGKANLDTLKMKLNTICMDLTFSYLDEIIDRSAIFSYKALYYSISLYSTQEILKIENHVSKNEFFDFDSMLLDALRKIDKKYFSFLRRSESIFHVLVVFNEDGDIRQSEVW